MIPYNLYNYVRCLLYKVFTFNTLWKFIHNVNQSKMKKGTVKFFNEAKGFGFIKSEDGQELFVHVSGLKDQVQENDNVVFDITEGKKGLNAVNVRLA
mgnify:CR=1 FL=1